MFSKSMSIILKWNMEFFHVFNLSKVILVQCTYFDFVSFEWGKKCNPLLLITIFM